MGGFKLKGATSKEPNECGTGQTLGDAKCVGSPCLTTDSKLCCNEKCTHSTTGFKAAKGTGKQKLECKAKETVASKGMCKGDCSDGDASVCCLKGNVSATTDATSSGLASLVGLLILLSTAS